MLRTPLENVLRAERPFFRVTANGTRALTDRGQLWYLTLGMNFIQNWYDFVSLDTEVSEMKTTVTKT